MTRIDRYLLIIYFRVLLICFTSIAGLMIIVHLFNSLTEFIDLSQGERGLASILFDYYLPYALSVFDMMSGLLVLMAVLFVITWIYRTNEFTALLAAGITKRRVLRPLMIASAGVIGLAAVSRELVIPRYQDSLTQQPQDLKGEMPRQVRPTADKNVGMHIQAKHMLPIRKQLVYPIINIDTGPLSVLGRKIQAALATSVPASSDHPKGFVIDSVTVPRSIDTIASIRTEDGKPLLLTRSDSAWLQPGQCFIASDLEFEMLRGGESWKKFASTSELIWFLRHGDVPSVDDVRVQIHSRFVRPLVDWTILLLGIPIVLTKPDRHMFWVAGVCILVVCGFSAVVMALNSAGAQGYLLSPLVAAWLPVLVVLPWSYQKAAAAFES